MNRPTVFFYERRLKHRWQILRVVGLPLVSGVLLFLTFPTTSLSLVAWVALTPWLVATQGASLPRAAGMGFLAGIAFFGPLLSWLLYVSVVPFYLMVVALILLALLQSLFFLVFGVAATVMFRRSLSSRLLLVPALWVGLEFARSIGFWGLSWGLLASSQEALASLQLLRITGPFGLSYLIVLVNILLVEAVRKWSAGGVVLGGIGLLAVAGIGLFNVGYRVAPPAAGNVLKIAIIQGNIPQNQKFDADFEATIKKRYMSLTDEALQESPDLIVWPETSIQRPLMDDPGFLDELKNLASGEETYLLVGSFHRDANTNRLHNSAFHISPGGNVERYDKRHLVPFGEYLPARELLGNIDALRVIGEDIAPGTDDTLVLPTAKGPLTVAICFESTLTRVVRPAVERGARLLVVMTNDAWFNDSPALRQHFELSRLRAIEYGLPLVQAANTGLSGFTDSRGRITQVGPINEAAVIVDEVVMGRQTTLYGESGDWFAYLSLAMSFLGLVRPARRKTDRRLAHL